MDNPPEIFLSYAHKNREDVDELYDLLTYKYKLSIWKDTKSIRTGYDFREEIYFGVQNCKLVLSCISQDYLNSKNCLKELKLANTLDKTCIFVLLENLPIDKIPSISMLVIGEQRCLIFKNRINNPKSKLWIGDIFKKLINDIGGIINKDLKQYDDVTEFKIKKTKEKYHVFFSFHVEIQPTIQVLAQQLEENDMITHFLSKEKINDNWKYFMKIKSAIECSSVFVSCITKSYLTNTNCMNEIDYAHETKKPQLIFFFEELTSSEIFSVVSKCGPQTEQLKVYEDIEKIYLTGHGTVFDQILFKVQNLVRKAEQTDTHHPAAQKIYDLFVTCDDQKQGQVSQFLAKLQPLKNLKIFHDTTLPDAETKRQPNYEAIENSEAVLAIVTQRFQESEACVAELSYAHRNLKPTSILMEDTVDLKNEGEFQDILQDTEVAKIENDLSLLEQDIQGNPLVEKIEIDLKLIPEKSEEPKKEEIIQLKK